MNHIDLIFKINTNYIPGPGAGDDATSFPTLNSTDDEDGDDMAFLRNCSGANFSKMTLADLYVSVSITCSNSFRFSSFKAFNLPWFRDNFQL